MRPFHAAFLVTDLQAARAFYGGLLGCREGRSTDTWVDFDFWGNQISLHVGPARVGVPCGQVDGVTVPIPHIGAILSWEEFDALAKRLDEARVVFVIRPTVRYRGEPGEQSTMFFHDPSGNAIEMKAFRDPEHIFSA